MSINTWFGVVLCCVALVACGTPNTECDAGVSIGSDIDGGATDAGAQTGLDAGEMTDGGLAPDAGRTDGGEHQVFDGGAAGWILAHFVDAGLYTGDFKVRTNIETPALVRDATACCSKYAFDIRETVAPDDRRVGLVHVRISNLVSSDAYGGGISTAKAEGLTTYMADVVVDPGWPTWVSYAETNKDGLVLDGSQAIYGEDVTIHNWNADSAIDNKASISQFVRLRLEGRGNRGIRYWRAGPHYLVDSVLQNTGGLGEGSIAWFYDCSSAVLNVYHSTFNGSPTFASSLVACDHGTGPTINYLTVDPRTTGEMHEMFNR